MGGRRGGGRQRERREGGRWREEEREKGRGIEKVLKKSILRLTCPSYIQIPPFTFLHQSTGNNNHRQQTTLHHPTCTYH